VKELENQVREENMVIAIAGNKCDLPEDNRRVTEQMGLNFAKRINAIF